MTCCLLKIDAVPAPPRHCEELRDEAMQLTCWGGKAGLLRGAYHRAALCADPLARNDGLNSSRRAAPHRGFELIAELGEFVGGDIADRPVVQSPIAPAPDIEALDGFDLGRLAFGRGGLGDAQIDHMRPPAADDGRDGPRTG